MKEFKQNKNSSEPQPIIKGAVNWILVFAVGLILIVIIVLLVITPRRPAFHKEFVPPADLQKTMETVANSIRTKSAEQNAVLENNLAEKLKQNQKTAADLQKKAGAAASALQTVILPRIPIRFNPR